MTLKPPTRTFPKLVMKEWPGRDVAPLLRDIRPHINALSMTDIDPEYPALLRRIDKALSDFTRVVEETGILDQEEAPLTKRGSKHD